jgi:hypothetical protein
LTRSIHWAAAPREKRKHRPMAATPMPAPLVGSFLPKSRITANDTAMVAGSRNAYFRKNGSSVAARTEARVTISPSSMTAHRR